MRLAVTGGRYYANAKDFTFTMTVMDHREHIDMIIEGGATGLDTMARNWAILNDRDYVTFKMGSGKIFGTNLAGNARNFRMIEDGKLDRLLVFPGGSGTNDMEGKANAMSIPVDHALRELAQDSSGNTLFVQENGAGGRTYWSDEIGGGVIVWDTSLVSREMVMLALEQEQ